MRKSISLYGSWLRRSVVLRLCMFRVRSGCGSWWRSWVKMGLMCWAFTARWIGVRRVAIKRLFCVGKCRLWWQLRHLVWGWIRRMWGRWFIMIFPTVWRIIFRKQDALGVMSRCRQIVLFCLMMRIWVSILFCWIKQSCRLRRFSKFGRQLRNWLSNGRRCRIRHWRLRVKRVGTIRCKKLKRGY